jgi:hypothetical protein
MFAERLIIRNIEVEPLQVFIAKEEADIASLKAVTVNQEAVDYDYTNGYLQFTVNVLAKKAAEICCTYRENASRFVSSEPISYTLKVAVRRYLSEFRDNYVSCNDFLYSTAAFAKRLLK